MKHRIIYGLLAAAAIGLFSCAPSGGYHGSARDAAGRATSEHAPAPSGLYQGAVEQAGGNGVSRYAPAPQSRPGLATGWGDEKSSHTRETGFTRASSKPAGTDVIFYNNAEGIEAMTTGTRRVAALQTAAGELVEWGIRGRGGYLPTFKEWGYGRRLVAGEKKSTYSIVVRNRSKSPLEIVASVDGLDVMDGKTASFAKRGYVVDPGKILEIDGFRTGTSSVAAFEFSGVADSYANLKHGDARNVGMIGIAVFTRQGTSPWTWMPDEIKTRATASPFAEAP